MKIKEKDSVDKEFVNNPTFPSQSYPPSIQPPQLNNTFNKER